MFDKNKYEYKENGKLYYDGVYLCDIGEEVKEEKRIVCDIAEEVEEEREVVWDGLRLMVDGECVGELTFNVAGNYYWNEEYVGSLSEAKKLIEGRFAEEFVWNGYTLFHNGEKVGSLSPTHQGLLWIYLNKDGNYVSTNTYYISGLVKAKEEIESLLNTEGFVWHGHCLLIDGEFIGCLSMESKYIYTWDVDGEKYYGDLAWVKSQIEAMYVEDEKLQLSTVYSDREENCAYTVAYDDGHGTIELVSKTFTCPDHAEKYAKEQCQRFLDGVLYVVKIKIDKIVSKVRYTPILEKYE